mgnify:FL=1
MKYQRERLIHDLKKFVCEIRFTKLNGELRAMKCTLRPENLPPITEEQLTHLDNQQAKPENQDVIVVWDVDKNGWRSFRVDSVEYCEMLEVYQ